MNKLNSAILEGNVVRKPELKVSPKGTSICIMPIAVDRYYKNSSGGYDTEVSYFDVESYGKLAEFCADVTDKGRGVRVVGRLKQNRWKNSEGENRSKVILIAEHIELKPVKKPTEPLKEGQAFADQSVPDEESISISDEERERDEAELAEAAFATADESVAVF